MLCSSLYLPSFPTRRSSDLQAEVIGLPPDPPQRPIGLFRVSAGVPTNSWLKSFVDEANLTFEIKQNPTNTIERDRKSTRLNSSHGYTSYAVLRWRKKTLHGW